MEASDIKPEASPEKLLVIGIYIKQNGQVIIEGNFDDEIACYGLLEKAKQFVQKAHMPSVVKPASFLQSLRQNGKH